MRPEHKKIKEKVNTLFGLKKKVKHESKYSERKIVKKWV